MVLDNSISNARFLLICNPVSAGKALENRFLKEGCHIQRAGFDFDFKNFPDQKKPNMILIDIAKGKWQFHNLSDLIRGKIDKSIPIVLIVNRSDHEAINHGFELDVSDYIVKPVHWMIMKKRIGNILAMTRLSNEFQKIEFQFVHQQKLAYLGNWELSGDHSMMICSEGVSRILGIPEPVNQIELKKFLSFVHPDDRKNMSALMRQAINRLYPFEKDHRIVLSGGNEKIVNHKVVMIWDEVKKRRTIMGIIQDITSRKQIEYLEKHRNRVLEMIVRNESLKSILDQLIHIVFRQNADAGCLISIKRGNQLYNQAHSINLPADFIKLMDGQEIGPKSGSEGTGAYLGEIVSASDIAKSPLWETSSDFARKYNLNACHAFPILSSKGEVFGVISIYFKYRCVLEESVSQLLKTVSDLASIAFERSRLNKQLVFQARHDNLTGLPNRFYFIERLNELIKHAERYDEKIALFFIDLDRFKHVNDSLGHKIGDLLLQNVARRISSLTRESDIVARVGGDEFVQILSRINARHDAAIAAGRLIEEVSRPYKIEGHELFIGASIGICLSPNDSVDPLQIQKFADIAMYYAKNRGGGRYQFFTSDMDEAAINRLEMENDLRKAVAKNEFELFYQPQFQLKDRKLIGFEALIRWNHPVYGRIPPTRFIPIAEKTKLIIPIGEWVLREACRQNIEWEKMGYGPFRIAVNFSVIQLLETDVAGIIAKTLKEFNLQPERLEVEITESIVIEDMDVVSKRLSDIRSLGIPIAIDDFGTGYSSMSYIEGLPVSAFKIDQSFVKKIGWDQAPDDKSKILLESMVNLADRLHLTCIAEGFESEDQFNYLRDIGCSVGQGFFFGVPMSVQDIKRHCMMEYECVLKD